MEAYVFESLDRRPFINKVDILPLLFDDKRIAQCVLAAARTRSSKDDRAPLDMPVFSGTHMISPDWMPRCHRMS